MNWVYSSIAICVLSFDIYSILKKWKKVALAITIAKYSRLNQGVSKYLRPEIPTVIDLYWQMIVI